MHVRVRHEGRVLLVLKPLDLSREQHPLLRVEFRLEAREGRQCLDAGDVILRDQAAHGILAVSALGNEDEPLPEQIAWLAQLGTDHVCLGDEVTPQQLREGGRIDRVSLHLGRS